MKNKFYLVCVASLLLVGCGETIDPNAPLESNDNFEIAKDETITVKKFNTCAFEYDDTGDEAKVGKLFNITNATLKIYQNEDDDNYYLSIAPQYEFDCDQITINNTKIKYSKLEYKSKKQNGNYVKEYIYTLNENEAVNGLTIKARIHELKDLAYLNENESLKTQFNGLQYSVMGDSISTYEGYNNNNDYNSHLSVNAVYYPCASNPDTKRVKAVQHTYWHLLMSDLDMNLCVNNAYSGSHVQQIYGNAQSACVDRCLNLHNDHTNTNPDLITVYIGINDLGEIVRHRSDKTFQIGKFDSVEDIKDGSGYKSNAAKTFATAYAMMIDKMINKYPNAKIYCGNLLTSFCNVASKDLEDLSNMNKTIKNICDYYNIGFVDVVQDTHFSILNGNKLYEDSMIHPNQEGMKLMRDAYENAIIKDFDYKE